MIYVIQLVLPLYENDQQPADILHSIVKAELTRHFGRCAAHTRSPAEGRWMADGRRMRSDMVIYEVISRMHDDEWWLWYQQVLQSRFHKIEVTIRTLPLI